jgi:hypothetical protein
MPGYQVALLVLSLYREHIATLEVSTSQFKRFKSRIQNRTAHETVSGTRAAYLVFLLHNARFTMELL